MKNLILAGFLTLMLLSCTNSESRKENEEYKKEIIAAEKAFCEMAAEEGIDKAFAFFAAEDAVMLRGDLIVSGKAAIGEYYEKQDLTGIKLEWAPDFVEVSRSGDLAYTYGRYTLTSSDSTGLTTENKGYFHTVWKRQPGGEWRFTWD